MPFRNRISQMGFGMPDIGALKSELTTKFDELLEELRRIRGVLEQIRDKP